MADFQRASLTNISPLGQPGLGRLLWLVASCFQICNPQIKSEYLFFFAKAMANFTADKRG